MNKKQKIGLSVSAILAAATLYATPYWTIYQIKSAIDEKKAEKVSSYIDFPSVKEHLKNSLNAKMSEKMTEDPGMRGNPFAGLGQMMMAAMIPPMVDALVTPENLARAMKVRILVKLATNNASKLAGDNASTCPLQKELQAES